MRLCMTWLCMQTDRPGLIAAVGNVLAKQNLNISFMTVTRTGRGQEAIMAIGIDEQPSQVGPRCLWQYMRLGLALTAGTCLSMAALLQLWRVGWRVVSKSIPEDAAYSISSVSGRRRRRRPCF